MVNGIETGDLCGFNKGRSSKFHEGSQTPEECWRTYRPKRGNNNKDENNSPKTLNDKNHQASSQIFRQFVRNNFDDRWFKDKQIQKQFHSSETPHQNQVTFEEKKKKKTCPRTVCILFYTFISRNTDKAWITSLERLRKQAYVGGKYQQQL